MDRIDFNIDDFLIDETVCNVDIEGYDMASLQLIEGEKHE